MSPIKIKRAAKISPLSQYPRTWQDTIEAIPASAKLVLTSAEIAELADAMHAQYQRSHTAGYVDAQ